MKYRKKPIVIDAWQYDGTNCSNDWPQWFRAASWYFPTGSRSTIAIKTLEGTLTAVPGDWIIRGVKLEIYPCRQDIFDLTYERCANDDK